jgi:hypothetical protein
MSNAELGFLLPLFDLATSLLDSEDADNVTMGLGQADPTSAMTRDDRDMDGFWVSGVVNTSVTACLDHVLTLRGIVLRENATITTSAPWTLLRAAIESCSVAVWVMDSRLRKTRRTRALRVWHYDYAERQKWEDDRGLPPRPDGKTGATWAAAVLDLATGLGIEPLTRVSTDLNYADTVAAGAAAVGWNRTEARARWREASAFAHGRFWPQLALTSPTGAERIPGGYGVALTLNEEHLEPLARLAHDLLNGALIRWAELSGPE